MEYDEAKGSMMRGQNPYSVDKRIQIHVEAHRYQQALELLSEAYLQSVFRYCLQMVHGEEAQAEEMTQKVFEGACRGITAFRLDSTVKTWLFAIAHKTFLNEVDKQRRRQIIYSTNVDNIKRQGHTDPPQEPEERLSSQQVSVTLRAALGELDPMDRSILLMRFGVDMSHELSVSEIAMILGKSRDTIYRGLKQSLEQLRRIMDDDRGSTRTVRGRYSTSYRSAPPRGT